MNNKWLTLIDRIFQQGHRVKNNLFPLVARAWPQQCLNMLVSICKHTHTQAQAERESHSSWYKFCKFWPHWAFKILTHADWSLQKQIVPLRLGAAFPLVRHTHSMTCIDLCTAVVLSLTKSDLSKPSCGGKRFKKKSVEGVAWIQADAHTHMTHPCSKCKRICTVSAT